MGKYIFEITEENKNKVEQFLKLLNIDTDIIEVENIKEVQEEEWPQEGDTYYLIRSEGTLDSSRFYNDYPDDINRITIGNCFRTEEEAEFEVGRLKVITEMKKFAEPEDRKWDGRNEHWAIYINIAKEIEYIYFIPLIRNSTVFILSLKKKQRNV